MVTTAVTVISGKALAHRSNTDVAAAELMGAGLALIREQLSGDVVEYVVVAERCGVALGDVQWLHRVRAQRGDTAPAEYVEGAKAYYRSALPRAADVADARNFLRELRKPRVPITCGPANAMLHALFGSMRGKRREDEAAMAKLAECVDIFSPASAALGRALDLWDAVPMHPVTLALAIKRLRASKTFEPSEAELREALDKVETESARLERHTWEWLRRLRQTDALMFETDRDGWLAAHAAADSNATAEMALGDNNDTYSQAVQALWEQKYDREQERTNTRALAACARPAAKRTKRLKAKGDDDAKV